MNIDFLIVGQGLAGSLLAWELIRRGCCVLVVDNACESASQVAAGLINPVTGMRWVKSSAVDELLPVARQTYSELEQFFQQKFYIEKPMLRVLNDEKDINLVNKRVADIGYHAYIGTIEAYKQLEPYTTPFGYVQQQQTGYLLTRPLLECLKNFFIARDCYRQEQLDYDKLILKPRLCWQGLNINRIVFCEGYLAKNNPWFNWLPFQPVKGEILSLNHNLPLPDRIINFGHWLIPLSDHLVRLGASFDREHINTDITEAGKEYLLNSLAKLYQPLSDAVLTHHAAGVRPCTLDKQPFLGFHPEHPRLAIFNGFGAKGSLQIPLLARQFADSLLDLAPVADTYDIKRL